MATVYGQDRIGDAAAPHFVPEGRSHITKFGIAATNFEVQLHTSAHFKIWPRRSTLHRGLSEAYGSAHATLISFRPHGKRRNVKTAAL